MTSKLPRARSLFAPPSSSAPRFLEATSLCYRLRPDSPLIAPALGPRMLENFYNPDVALSLVSCSWHRCITAVCVPRAPEGACDSNPFPARNKSHPAFTLTLALALALALALTLTLALALALTLTLTLTLTLQGVQGGCCGRPARAWAGPGARRAAPRTWPSRSAAVAATTAKAAG